MAKRKITIEDLRRFKFVSDPQISPDGSKVAFVLSTINYKEDKYERHIWTAETETGKTQQYTHGKNNDTYPRWSPDGTKLLFLSRGREPEKKTQLYTIPLTGGEAKLLADTEEGVNKPVWAPNSKDVLFVTKVWTEKKPKTDVKHIKRIRYKFNAMGFFEGRRDHLFTVRTGRKPRQITKGEYDVESYGWSPDGKEIAYITNMEPDADTSRVRDIYKVPAKGGEPKKITESDYAISGLAYSPDGKQIALIGYDQPQELAADYDLYLMPSDGGEKNCLTDGFNRSLMMGIGSDLRVASPNPGAVWSKDGKRIYFLTADTPTSNIYSLDVKSKKIKIVVKGKAIDGLSISDDESKIAYIAMTATEIGELYLHTNESKKLTSFNTRTLAQLDLVKPEHFTFINRLGRVVDGWVIKPVDFDPNEKYPCVLQMHGGPRGVYGDGMFHEFHLLSAEGYAVIYTNPRGSAGYEEEYTQAVMRHYGEVDHEDFMDFTDEALKRYGWIDADRLGLTGGSYGGYTTNWIITQTDRFKAGVTCRSICSWVSKFGVSDIGFMQPESISGHKTYWGEAITEQLKHSPIYYVDRVKTPCLIIHSELDYRCPMAEAEQWYTALKLNNVPTELVRFPNENHELSRSGKPKHREERLEHILRWFKEYI